MPPEESLILTPVATSIRPRSLSGAKPAVLTRSMTDIDITRNIVKAVATMLTMLITGCRRTSCQVCLNILDIITITDLSIHTEELSMG